MSAAWADWFFSVYDSFRKYGLDLTKEQFSLKCDGFFEKPEPFSDKGELTVFERRIRRLGQEAGLNLSANEIKETVKLAVNVWQKHIALDPDAPITLEKLKKDKTIGLITNFDHPPHIYNLLAELNLIRFFDVVAISGEIGFKKPDERIFNYALNHVGVKPDLTIYVGDTDVDIDGAFNAGVTPVLIYRDDISTAANANDYKVDSLQPGSSNRLTFHPKNPIIIKKLTELLNI